MALVGFLHNLPMLIISYKHSQEMPILCMALLLRDELQSACTLRETRKSYVVWFSLPVILQQHTPMVAGERYPSFVAFCFFKKKIDFCFSPINTDITIPELVHTCLILAEMKLFRKKQNQEFYLHSCSNSISFCFIYISLVIIIKTFLSRQPFKASYFKSSQRQILQTNTAQDTSQWHYCHIILLVWKLELQQDEGDTSANYATHTDDDRGRGCKPQTAKLNASRL